MKFSRGLYLGLFIAAALSSLGQLQPPPPATQAEADDGTILNKFLSPKTGKNASWAGGGSTGATITSPIFQSNNIVLWHYEQARAYDSIQAANTAAAAGDWVVVTGNRPILTNNFIAKGVNYDIWPPVIYVEQSTSSAGYGIIDDRGTGATTNKIIFHDNVWYSGGTNGSISGSSYLGNDNTKGLLVTTNINTELHVKFRDIYTSLYDTSQADTGAAINALAISSNSIIEFDNSYPFAASFQNTNQIGQTKTINDTASTLQMVTNGFTVISSGNWRNNGGYSIISVLDDPTAVADFRLEGSATLWKTIYGSWSSPNWRYWLRCSEIKFVGAATDQPPMTFSGAGKVYIDAQKIGANTAVVGPLITVSSAYGTSNMFVWVKSPKIQADGLVDSYALINGGELKLDVDTYTNTTATVTNGFIVQGGKLLARNGEMAITMTAGKGLRMVGGQATLQNVTIDTTAVNNAGNNPIVVQGGSLELAGGVGLLAPALADSIIAGSAMTVTNWGTLKLSTAPNGNVAFSPNGGFTVGTNSYFNSVRLYTNSQVYFANPGDAVLLVSSNGANIVSLLAKNNSSSQSLAISNNSTTATFQLVGTDRAVVLKNDSVNDASGLRVENTGGTATGITGNRHFSLVGSSSATYGAASAKLFVDSGISNSLSASETILRTTTTVANTLGANGESIEFWVSGTFAANANAKQVKIYFAGTAIFDSTSLLFNSGSWDAHVIILRVNSTTVECDTHWGSSSTLLASSTGQATLTVTLSGSNAIEVKGTAAIANSDITCRAWKGEWKP